MTALQVLQDNTHSHIACPVTGQTVNRLRFHDTCASAGFKDRQKDRLQRPFPILFENTPHASGPEHGPPSMPYTALR